MLYIQDHHGVYLPAPKETVLSEAKRLSSYQLRRGAFISTSAVARDAVRHRLAGHECEVFACLFLDSQHRILAWLEMFRGTINSATVHPREVVKEALQLNAAAVILVHNHPSGYPQPSDKDVELTIKLKSILQVIDVHVLDHLVVGDEVISFADLGLLR